MTLRKVPGALTLGLLASLMAHAVLYAGEHAMGGPYHGLLLEVALAACVSLLVFFGALAWSEAGATADGSVLAARLRERLPGLQAVIPVAAVWFAAAEAVEPHHATAPPLVIVLSLAVAAWLVVRLACAVACVFAEAIIAIARTTHPSRTPAQRRPAHVPSLPRLLWAYRRFARPPPIALSSPRA